MKNTAITTLFWMENTEERLDSGSSLLLPQTGHRLCYQGYNLLLLRLLFFFLVISREPVREKRTITVSNEFVLVLCHKVWTPHETWGFIISVSTLSFSFCAVTYQPRACWSGVCATSVCLMLLGCFSVQEYLSPCMLMSANVPSVS